VVHFDTNCDWLMWLILALFPAITNLLHIKWEILKL